MEYTIVPMDRSHVGQIAELERECFSAPWSEAMLTEALFDAQASFIVAESEDGGLLGYAGLHVVLDEGYIDNVAVFPAHRRKGVASALLGALIAYGEKEGMAFLTLEVRPSNQGARALYEAHGFQQVGERKNFYQNPVENALLLTRYLDE